MTTHDRLDPIRLTGPDRLTEPARTLVRRRVEEAWARAVESGALPAVPDGTEPPVVEVTRPADPAHGDFATNLAFKLAKPLRMAPLETAKRLAAALGETDEATDPLDPVRGREVAPPGFLNLWLSPTFVERAIDAARDAGEAFGRLTAVRPLHINVEFVSANPTGPLHIGNARGAFVGDLLCRTLEAAGHRVTREYYFNDFGSQIRQLGASVAAIRDGTQIPEDGYRGAYVHDLAAAVPPGVLAEAAVPGADRDWIVGLWAQEQVRAGIEASLAHLGVRFDVWKSEGSLYAEGWVDRATGRLDAAGFMYEQDGALWFRSTTLGDDKDRVVRRSSGAHTYFASDVGYVMEKFSRGFDHLVYIWGADHHGTVARVRNAAQAMGYDREAVEMLLVAWVRFVRDGIEVSMSKRAGEFISLDELLAEVGVDAARWFFGARSHNSGIDFDIELAKRQSADNPVYYVQYAHARICSILRKAEEAGLRPAGSREGVARKGGSLAEDPIGLGLAKLLLQLPEVVEDAAAHHETQGITAFATELATAFHAYYRDRRVVDQADPETSAARLALVSAVRLTLANTLALLGISAPDSM